MDSKKTTRVLALYEAIGGEKEKNCLFLVSFRRKKKKAKTDLSLSCYLCFCFFSSLDEIERRQIEYICASQNLLYYHYFVVVLECISRSKQAFRTRRRKKISIEVIQVYNACNLFSGKGRRK